MKHYDGSDPLTAAKNEVLERMRGCDDEVCSACKHNYEAINKLITEAQIAAIKGVLAKALAEVGNDLA